MGHDAGVGEKAELRKRIRELRAGRAAAAFHPAMLDALPPIGSCAGFLATEYEPNIDALLNAHLTRGDDLYLPRVEHMNLDWVRVTSLDDTDAGSFGIREPRGPGSLQLPNISALYVPALAVDKAGFRLGQGGGFFDRALTHVRPYSDGGPLRIAIVHDDEIFTRIPRESHDVQVDVICTPTQVIWTAE